MALFLYRLIVAGYGLIIVLASIGNHKARQWRSGRKHWRSKLQSQILKLGSGKRVWFHCASYGEFEQGRPLMEALKQREPETKIILSFFSPSGYLPMKDWQGADLICYLPLDSPENAKDFLEIINPNSIFFIKYEYWLFFLEEIKKRHTPAFLISATFKMHQPFFRWYGKIFRSSLSAFRILFLQDQSSCELLTKIGINNFVLSGDTRIDRVLKIRADAEGIPVLEEFKGKSKLLIAGSSWPKDEALVIEAFSQLKKQNLKLVIVPHNLHPGLQKETAAKLKRYDLNFCFYSAGVNFDSDVLILDTMGLLSRAYVYADLVHIGGGFDHGIHNILEPAVFGIPVCISGKGHEKYNEAVTLLNRGDLKLVQNSEEFSQYALDTLSNTKVLDRIKEDLSAYFKENSNVTKRIFDQIDGLAVAAK